MAGLFDYSDPEIALAAGLLSGRGNLGGIMGRSLMDAQRAYLATSEDKRRNKQADLQAQQMQMQLAQAEQERQQRRKMDEFRGRIPMPGVGPDGVGPPNASQADLLSHEAVRAGFGDPIAYINSLRKDNTPHISKPGDVARDAQGNIIWQNPDKDKEDKDVAFLKLLHGDNTPAFWAAMKQLETKRTTHQPGATMNNYGPPLPFVDPETKQTLYVQPPTRPGAPSQVVTDPRTGKPASKPADPASVKAPTEFEAKAGLYFKSMTTATGVLDQIEKSNAWRPSMAETVPGNPDIQNLVRSETRQKYVQAQRQWIDSINRVRSGANLPEIEYDRAVRTFFPTYGEGESVRQQKAAMRKQEEQAMQAAAGRALKEAPSAPASNVMRFDAQGNPIK
jgi:hypothetical protein